MVEKHEFDVGILTRGSQSPQPERPSQPVDSPPRSSPSPSPPSRPPPPYSVQDEGAHLTGPPGRNSEYPFCHVILRSGDFSPLDQPFSHAELSSSTPPTLSTTTYDFSRSPRFPGRRRDLNVANNILKLKEPPPGSRIMTRRNRGKFRSEVWEAPEKTPKFYTTQPAKNRRYYSRTFPADACTQPHLDECYPQPYGTSSVSPSSPPARPHKSTQKLYQELEHFEIRLHDLQSAMARVERQYNLLILQLPRTHDNCLNFEPSVWGEWQQTIYQNSQFLENEHLNMSRNLKIMVRERMPICEEVKKRREARDFMEKPLKIMSRERNDRIEGRKWLRKEIPWAHAVNMGRGGSYMTNAVDMMRRVSF
ncbi:hypothetical protein NHQ30_005622 [Ciborinia camelliae]|nr:hypothetical protein NHQ30_005622 [Ciborinia camelliae]